MSRRGSGEVFAVGCAQVVSSWAHGRFGLADVKYLAVALSGSLGKGGREKKIRSTDACSWCVDFVG